MRTRVSNPTLFARITRLVAQAFLIVIVAGVITFSLYGADTNGAGAASDTNERVTHAEAEEESEETDTYEDDEFFFDEDAMFGEEEIVDAPDDITNAPEMEEEGITFSGKTESLFASSFTRDWLFARIDGDYYEFPSLSATFVSDLFLDIRLRNSVKTFFDFEITYVAQRPAALVNEEDDTNDDGNTNDEDDFSGGGVTVNDDATNHGTYTTNITTRYTNDVITNDDGDVVTNGADDEEDEDEDETNDFFENVNPNMVQMVEQAMENASIRVKELFLDVNIHRRVFFRVGKQYLRWGRGFLWNPTDVINIEQRNALSPDASLEGTYGVKIHAPFGTRCNIYGFIDVRDAEHLDEPALAGKVEFLVPGIVEFSFSAWQKKGYRPIYGVDATSTIPLINVTVWGEAGFHPGGNKYYLARVADSYEVELLVESGAPSDSNATTNNMGTNTITNYITHQNDEFHARISLGAMKSFDLFDVPGRVLVVGEVFWNMGGYTKNWFLDPNDRNTLLSQGLYEPNRHSEWYSALFLTVSQFILTDMKMQLNAVKNWNDGSSLASLTLTYAPGFNVTLKAQATGFFGEEDCEYTFAGRGLDTSFSVILVY